MQIRRAHNACPFFFSNGPTDRLILTDLTLASVHASDKAEAIHALLQRSPETLDIKDYSVVSFSEGGKRESLLPAKRQVRVRKHLTMDFDSLVFYQVA